MPFGNMIYSCLRSPNRDTVILQVRLKNIEFCKNLLQKPGYRVKITWWPFTLLRGSVC